MKSKMSQVIASYVCRKNVFYNQTSLRGFSTFSTISLAFSIASVIPALLKLFIAISSSSLIVLYRTTIHFACSGLITESLRETLASAAVFPALNCFDTLLASQHSVTRRLISQNWSVTLTVVVKKTSTLTLILMNQLAWPLINYLFNGKEPHRTKSF